MNLLMQRFIIILGILLVVSDLIAKNGAVPLHTVKQMNLKLERLNSHMGEEKYSVLEPMYEYMQVIPQSFLRYCSKKCVCTCKKRT